jgi:hypothetical protein
MNCQLPVIIGKQRTPGQLAGSAITTEVINSVPINIKKRRILGDAKNGARLI